MSKIAKCLLAIGLCGSLFTANAAHAHASDVTLAKWKPQYAHTPPEVRQWYSRQRNSRGDFCCDQSDGHAYYLDYSLNADGSVTLADGTRIPAWQVLKGPNPTGHAIWWHTANFVSYCFAPGSLF